MFVIVADTVEGVEDFSSGEEEDYPTLVGQVTPIKIQVKQQLFAYLYQYYKPIKTV